jgi:hypothetical protein
MSLSYTGQLCEFIKKIKQNGSCEWNYCLPDELSDCLDSSFVGLKNFNFKSHKELDQFVINLKSKSDFFNEFGIIFYFFYLFKKKKGKYYEDYEVNFLFFY